MPLKVDMRVEISVLTSKCPPLVRARMSCEALMGKEAGIMGKVVHDCHMGNVLGVVSG